MAKYIIEGFIISIPDRLLNDAIRTALQSNRYEGQEVIAVKRHLTDDDRVLELGAGLGYISMQIASIVGGENLLSVEANLDMIPVIEQNLATNLYEGVTVVNAAVVPDSYEKDYARFHKTAAFWASSTNPTIAKQWRSTKSVDVPAVRIGDLIKDHRPSVIIMDIEGGEQGLFDTPLPDHIRLMVIEFHPKLYPDQVIKKIFDQLSASNLAYYPFGSRGAVVVFKRLQDSA